MRDAGFGGLFMVLVSGAALGSGCGLSSVTAPELLDPAKPGTAFEGKQCSAVRPQTEPDLMGWDSGSRANLKILADKGVVAVRYHAQGCNVELEVLNCVGKGSYDFSAYKANETKTAKSVRDLYAELPIGAASLEAKIAGGRALRTDYMLAGMLTLPRVMKTFPSAELEGDCDDATHVVSKLYIGGFGMAAGESEKLAAGARIFGVGIGGGQDRTAERLTEEGSAESCKKAQDEARRDPLCNVPLRIGLTPIEGRSEGSCPVGSKWDASSKGCVEAKAPSRVQCPPGTELQGDHCAAVVSTQCPSGMRFEQGKGCMPSVNTSCPGGTRFEEGKGCVPVAVAPVPVPVPVPAPAPPPVGGVPKVLVTNDILGVVTAHRAAIRAVCWDPALARRASDGPTSAKINVTTVVTPAGAVESAAARGGEAFPGLASCVERQVQGWSFPQASDKTTVSIPFTFAQQ